MKEMHSPPDLVGAIEALYQLELPRARWLKRVTEVCDPFLRQRGGIGVAASLYTCSDPFSFSPEDVVLGEGTSERQRDVFCLAQRQLSPTFVAEAHLNLSWSWSLSSVPGWSEIPPVASGEVAASGVGDACFLNAIEPDGTGATLVGGLQAPVSPSESDRVAFALLARHFTAAHRLLRRLESPVSPDGAAAVVEPGGAIRHARGLARLKHSRDELRRAVTAIEGARAGRRTRHSVESVQAWPSVVGGRWTVVDHFESDGRRFLLAVDNRPTRPKARPLSEREREVVRRALRGCSNKEIAYDLGLSHSTIKVLMARAAAKAGARSRKELLVKLGDRPDIVQSVEIEPSAVGSQRSLAHLARPRKSQSKHQGAGMVL
jgi:DNA-binding CsgD family transcriptional regulator